MTKEKQTTKINAMRNKEMTPEQNAIKRIACDFFCWWYKKSGTNTEQGFDEWAKQNSERLHSFENSIRRDHHEKS